MLGLVFQNNEVVQLYLLGQHDGGVPTDLNLILDISYLVTGVLTLAVVCHVSV